jgi:hypothetical protein
VVTELCIQNRNISLDLCYDGTGFIADYFIGSELPVDKSSDCQSCEEPENRIETPVP